MATLYVTEQGAQIEKEYLKLVVTKEDETLASVPAAEVNGVVLMGNIGVTTPAMVFLLERGIPLVLLDSRGKLRGRLLGATPPNLKLRHQQYRCTQDPALALAVSRAIVGGKLANCLTLTQRMMREREASHLATAALEIKRAMEATASAKDLAELRGIEGSGTKVHFAALRSALQHDWGFAKRARRPPPDPVNALLSLGYTFLGESIFAALEIVGLDPYDGFYHADKYGRPALALDLMEEFRPLIVDSLVLHLINREIIEPNDFRADPQAGGGVFLTRAGMKKFLHHWNARVNTLVTHPVHRQRWTYVRCFEAQARVLRQVVEGELPGYLPFHMR
jgi:CRISPR-associated protein Cas1